MKCAFTGPRPKSLPFKCHKDDPAYIALKHRLTGEILRLCGEGVNEFFCGMALGADLLCCEIALAMKEKYPEIKIHAVVPFKGQTDAWNPESRALYDKLLKQCDTAVYLHGKYEKNSYMFRNYYLIDSAEILLAVCARESIPLRSGTGAIVRYAKSRNRRIIFVPPVI